MKKSCDHPKSVKYPQAKETETVLMASDSTRAAVDVNGHLIQGGSLTLRDSLAESIYAHAVGAWIRDTCHRPSISEVEFEKIAKISIQAAETFRKTHSNP